MGGRGRGRGRVSGEAGCDPSSGRGTNHVQRGCVETLALSRFANGIHAGAIRLMQHSPVILSPVFFPLLHFAYSSLSSKTLFKVS